MIIQEFEDIQKIWDSQKQETLYAIDESSLHHRIRRKEQQSNRMASARAGLVQSQRVLEE